MQTKEEALTLVELSEHLLTVAAKLKEFAVALPAEHGWQEFPSATCMGRADIQRLSSLARSYTAELENFGDTVSAFGSGAPRLRDEALITLLQDVTNMASRTAWLLQQSLDHFVAQDLNTAYSLIQQACLVRGLYPRIYYNALDCAAACPGSVEEVGMILSGASNFECTARYVICVCEQTTRAAAPGAAVAGLEAMPSVFRYGWAAANAESCGH